jgi:hypothetical protein
MGWDRSFHIARFLKSGSNIERADWRRNGIGVLLIVCDKDNPIDKAIIGIYSFSFLRTRVIKDTSFWERVLESKELLEKTEKESVLNPQVPNESLEKEVCWDKPFTLSGGCCQD